MNQAIPFPKRVSESHTAPHLDLPEPRIWTPEDLAAFFRLSVHWARKVAKSSDPPPRIGGIRLLRFDTHSPAFLDWIRRRLNFVDSEDDHE